MQDHQAGEPNAPVAGRVGVGPSVARASRRTVLQASVSAAAGLGLSGLGLPGAGRTGTAHAAAETGAAAKSTILFFLCGGASHIDMWDMKPAAPGEFRGEFRPIATSADGVTICEHMPLLARQAHHLALVHGVTDAGRATGDHHAGYYYNLTGHAPDLTFRTQGNDRRPLPGDWPSMACVVGMKRPRHRVLPQTFTLPYHPSRPPYTRPGQFAGRLGREHDPFLLQGSFAEPMSFTVPDLVVEADAVHRLDDRRRLLADLEGLRRGLDHEASMTAYTRQQQRAFELLAAAGTAGAFDIAAEPAAVRERYGATLNGTSLLMARRLVEAGVPFITVFWSEYDEAVAKKCASGGGWDTHANNFACLRENLLPEFDRVFSALVEDLHDRGLLDSTLLLVTSEMGRKPRIGDPRSGGPRGAGRDHWTSCMSVVLAGGGIQGGTVHGATDARAEYPAGPGVDPADVARTVYGAMGIRDLWATDPLGRPYELLEGGRVLPILG
jgi:hypothetical protein